MPNCRSIPPEAWQQARDALVFYFSYRNGAQNAEDLAQETLAALWRRDDFEFRREEDFLKVCYAFASRISLSGYRRSQRHSGAELDPDAAAPAAPFHGLEGAELQLMLEEVLRTCDQRLNVAEREAIGSALANAAETGDEPPSVASRVRLFRARKKLARLTGWKKSTSP